MRSLRFEHMPSADEVKSRIEAGDSRRRGRGADRTTRCISTCVVRASAFDGLSRVQQHRLVMDIFDGELGGAIHALALKTEVPT